MVMAEFHRVRSRFSYWKNRNVSLWVLNLILHGLFLPVQETEGWKLPAPYVHKKKEIDFLDELRQEYLACGKIIPGGDGRFVGQTFVRMKANGKMRCVYDLRQHNNCLDKPPKFHLPRVTDLKHMVQPGDVFLKVDLTNGFHHVGLDGELAK